MTADLTEPMRRLLREVHRLDQGARSDDDGRRERVFHPGPSTGQTAKALVRRGLLRYASASGHAWDVGVECTPAGCAALAEMERR